METLHFEKTTELKKNLKLLKEKLEVSLSLKNKTLSLEGEPIKEYEASKVLEAMQFGFSAEKALLLKEDFMFKVFHIRDFTRRKNLKDVKARIIGKRGKTKNTIENLTESYLIIKENEIGAITPLSSSENLTTALENLIKGAKQSNIYRFLEKSNTTKRTNNLKLKE